MLHEKAKLLVHRLIWFFLLLLGITIPIIMLLSAGTSSEEIEIVDDSGYIDEYYESLDETCCEIEVVFNCEVNSGYIWIAFYDSNAELLATENGYFYGYGDTVSSTFFIDGKVDSYEILSYDITASNDDWALLLSILIIVFIPVIIICFSFFIGSLLLSCKRYEYNGNEIVVYAGWYHHYIKFNGKKVDEHNTLISFTAISLSCILTDGTDIKATITMTNRISLKINNLLYTKRG